MKIVFISMALFAAVASHSQKTYTVYFDFDRYDLTVKTRLQLDSLLTAEANNSSQTIFVLDGYCDFMGSASYNERLSLNRVLAVKKYFLENGIAAGNIQSAIGHGEKDPLNENKTDEERRLDRIVTISVINGGTPNTKTGKTITEKIADTTVTVGTNIILRNINFVGGMHRFLPESEPMLQELLEAMQTYPGLIIRIEGHICCQPGPADGPDLETGLNNLSEARARAVMDFLVDNGINAGRVSYKGFGHSAPLYSYPERTEEEQKLNRRVEIKIISK